MPIAVASGFRTTHAFRFQRTRSALTESSLEEQFVASVLVLVVSGQGQRISCRAFTTLLLDVHEKIIH